MIFKFGKYVRWVGPYQLADLLQHIGVSDEKCHSIGEKLSNTWVGDFCQWFHDKKKHKIVVKIEPHDIWSMDYTLAQIIHPLLVELKEKKHGTPFVKNSNIPEELKVDISDSHFGYTDGGWNEKGWDWIMDEMIWAFERIKLDDIDEMCYDNGKIDIELSRQLNDRLLNGTKLFGIYFTNLWD
jgi:hypothetical protein